MAKTMRELSPIGFGAFKIGRNQGAKYPRPYDLPDDRSVGLLLNGLLDMGINYIDTAPAYGSSEERIGRAIGHRRSEFVISTKVGESFEGGISNHDFSAVAVRRSLERSLKRLRTDVIDMVLIHADRDDLGIVERTDAPAALLSLREKGLVHAIGLSGYTAAAFRSAMAWADVLMLEYHPGDVFFESTIRDAASLGKTVLVKKGLSSGRLEAESAIPFVLQNPGVASLVVGSLSLHHMEENLRAAREVEGRRTRE